MNNHVEQPCNGIFFFDHGGVLDGVSITNKPAPDDLVLQHLPQSRSRDGHMDPERYQVLRNGVQIVQMLNDLARYGWLICYHSRNKEEDQMLIYKQIANAAREKGLAPFSVFAMAAYEPTVTKSTGLEVGRFANYSANNPQVFRNQEGIIVCGYGGEAGDGKSCTRTVLEKSLSIAPEHRKFCVVVDDGAPNVTKAIQEGYLAHLVIEPKDIDLKSATKEFGKEYVKTLLEEQAKLPKDQTLYCIVKKVHDDYLRSCKMQQKPETHDYEPSTSTSSVSSSAVATTSVTDCPQTLFAEGSKAALPNLQYSSFSDDIKCFLSEFSKQTRSQINGNLNTETYWNTLDDGKKLALIELYYREYKPNIGNAKTYENLSQNIQKRFNAILTPNPNGTPASCILQ